MTLFSLPVQPVSDLCQGDDGLREVFFLPGNRTEDILFFRQEEKKEREGGGLKRGLDG